MFSNFWLFKETLSATCSMWEENQIVILAVKRIQKPWLAISVRNTHIVTHIEAPHSCYYCTKHHDLPSFQKVLEHLSRGWRRCRLPLSLPSLCRGWEMFIKILDYRSDSVVTDANDSKLLLFLNRFNKLLWVKAERLP